MLVLLSASAAKGREVLRALFEDNSQRLEQELQCSKRVKVMHTIKLWVVAWRLEAGDVARREAACKSEARDPQGWEVIRGLKVSHRVGRRRGEQSREVLDGAHRRRSDKGGCNKGAAGVAGAGVRCRSTPWGVIQ